MERGSFEASRAIVPSERIVWPDELDHQFTKGIINAMPYDAYALVTLASVFEMTYGKVGTAMIRLVGRPKIVWDPDWSRKWVLTWADAVAVVHHEIIHKMLYHAKEDLEAQMDMSLSLWQINFLHDIKVQGMSYQLLHHPVYQDIWRRYYGPEIFPQNLLYSGSACDSYTRRQLHQAIYSPFGVSPDRVARIVFEEVGIADLLAEYIPGHPEPTGEAGSPDDPGEMEKGSADEDEKPFVGSHGQQGVEEDSRPPPMDETLGYADDLSDRIRQMRDRREQDLRQEAIKKEAAKGQGISEELIRRIALEDIGMQTEKGFSTRGSEYLLELERVQDLYYADQRIRQRMMQIATETEFGKAAKAVRAMVPDKPAITTVPNFRDKKAVALYAAGYWPLYYKTDLYDPKGLCHVYIDASGSQNHVISFVIRLFTQLRDHLHPKLHIFSTFISDVHKSELRPDMEISTSGGTDFNVVVQNALRNDYKKCLVITDGWSDINDVNVIKSRSARQKFLVGFTEDNHGKGFVPLTWRSFDIPRD